MVLFSCLILAACNTSNFGDGLSGKTPSQEVGNIQTSSQISENALVEGQSEPPPGQLASNIQQFASLPSGPGITFLPVTGAPQRSVTALSTSLSNAANSNGINLIPSNASGAAYRIKGYFSALDDGKGTLLVYVWDVLDPSGSRLHRISGQQHTNRKSADPWSAVSNNEIDRVASDTMAQLRLWLAKR
ncbi:MAG: hypothetical protein COB78_03945 [Hyphomicrobiales bacterium]|nr:MAG: hypothetical protein COB78_03945 [Hyphomicrobiales bacterium]